MCVASRLGLATAFLILSSLSSARAETEEYAVCRDYASAAADSWSAGEIERAEDDAVARPGTVVVIAYGKTYLVPQSEVGVVLKPKSVGQRIWDRKRVFHEELARCLNNP